MKPLVRKLLMILLVNLFSSCNKESICDSYPCESQKLSIKDFYEIKYRRGIWVNVTYYLKKTNYQDTIQFINDTSWSMWGFNPFTKKKSGFYNKKYLIKKKYNSLKPSGYIENYANFLDSATQDYRTYDWYLDTINGYIYFDFNRDFRSISEPVVYSRFIKIE